MQYDDRQRQQFETRQHGDRVAKARGHRVGVLSVRQRLPPVHQRISAVHKARMVRHPEEHNGDLRENTSPGEHDRQRAAQRGQTGGQQRQQRGQGGQQERGGLRADQRRADRTTERGNAERQPHRRPVVTSSTHHAL